ncbi:hypothetical protein AB0M35_26145 [Micromonospora sp. NPDC051196]|uniref:effector-associated constant component EACC1 n=1 Tax=Micromonospora sp. NPDC051196 TaxID=3155281 RepID=UPI00341564C4
MYLTLSADENTHESGVEPLYEDLCDWLVTEPDLRPLVSLHKRTPRQGELGGLVEALTIAVGSGGAITVLAGALGVWLSRARNRAVRIEIRQQRGGGRTIVLDARNTRTDAIERMLRELTAGEHSDQPAGS